MTILEVAAIKKMMNDINHPSVLVTSAQFNRPPVIIKRRPDGDKLLKSKDYKAGWCACRDEVYEVLKFIATATHDELHKYTKKEDQ